MASKAEQERNLLERVAYHEAGHAVAAIRFKRSFRHATIVPKGDGLGHVLYAKFHESFRPDVEINRRVEDSLEKCILIAMSGMAAEKRFVGRRNWGGGEGDMKNAIDMAGYLYEGEVLGKYLGFMIARADSLMRYSIIWAQVEAVAAALVEHRHLSAPMVRRVCSGTILDGTRIGELMAENLAREQAESDAIARRIESGELAV